MPYTIHTDRDLIEISFSGDISLSDLRSVAVDMSAAEEMLPVTPHRLAMLNDCTGWALTADTILAFTTLRKAQALRNPVKTAIVPGSDLNIEFARMFKSLNDHPQVTIEIFETREAALAWLHDSLP